MHQHRQFCLPDGTNRANFEMWWFLKNWDDGQSEKGYI
jgi:hypothetical protein